MSGAYEHVDVELSACDSEQREFRLTRADDLFIGVRNPNGTASIPKGATYVMVVGEVRTGEVRTEFPARPGLRMTEVWTEIRLRLPTPHQGALPVRYGHRRK